MTHLEDKHTHIHVESKFDVHTSDDTYYAISSRHLQTAFYLLVLGYVLAFVCFVTVIMGHLYTSKGREQKCTSSWKVYVVKHNYVN